MGMRTMKRKAVMKKAILLLAAVTLVRPAFAGSSADLDTDIFGTSSSNSATGTVTPTQTTQFPVATPLPVPVAAPAPVSNASINPAANQGQQSQNGGAGANDAAGAALIAAGAALMANPPTQPAGAALIAMGMLALAQGAADSNAANQSGQTAAASVNGTTTPTTPTNPALGTGTSAFQSPAAATGTAALTSAGYSVTPTGLVNPDGSLTPNSAFNSPGGMAAAGMSPATIKAVQDALANVQGSGPKISNVAVSEGGGGGSGSGAGNDFSILGRKSAFQMTDAMKKQMVAGKTVLFDGDPIGVRGQNIFDMIHTAYQRKSDRHDFLDGGGLAAAPALRSPASLAPAKAYRPPPRDNR